MVITMRVISFTIKTEVFTKIYITNMNKKYKRKKIINIDPILSEKIITYNSTLLLLFVFNFIAYLQFIFYEIFPLALLLF